MEKDALAFQLLLLMRSCPQMSLTDISRILKSRSDFHSAEEKEAWEAKFRNVCAYLKKLNFIKCNGSEITMTSNGTKHVNVLFAPITNSNKEDVNLCN